jgi:hypothetical protein
LHAINPIPVFTPDEQGVPLRKFTMSLAAVVAAGALATPAVAATQQTDLSGAGAFGFFAVSTDTQGRDIAQTAVARPVAGDLNRINIAVSCTASAPEAAAVGILSCYLLGANGVSYDISATSVLNGRPSDPTRFAKPGVADNVDGVANVPLQGYTICMQSQALYRDNTTPKTDVVCNRGSAE